MTEAAAAHHGAAFQRWRGRQVDVALRQKDRAELAALRAKIRDARAARRTRVRAAMAACREARLVVKAKAVRARAKLRAYIARAKLEAKGQCASSRELEREQGTRSIASLAAARDALRSDIRLRRRAEGMRVRERLSKREARGESDDEVRGNLPRELAPVWERVKSRIHAGPRRSRTEAFLEWVHDNSASVERYLNEAVEGDVEELVRQEAAHYANPGSAAYRAATARVLRLSYRIDHGGDSPRARAAYGRAIARWRAASRGVPPRVRARVDVELGRYGRGRKATGAAYRNPDFLVVDGPHAHAYPSETVTVMHKKKNPKRRRNPYVAGSTVEGQLVPGTFRWNRRGIGNPGRPSSTHGRRLAFYANMAKGALRKGDRAAALEWRRKFLAERKNPAPVRRAPPGNPDRFASRRTGWAALAQARPAAGAAAARAMCLNPDAEYVERLIREARQRWRRGDATSVRLLFAADEMLSRMKPGPVVHEMRVRVSRLVDVITKDLAKRKNPLSRGFSRKSIAKNIKRERRRGVKRGQAVAIALNVARKAAKKKLGRLPKYLRKRNPNAEGLTLTQWLRAAGLYEWNLSSEPTSAQRAELFHAWKRGEDPSEWRATRRAFMAKKNPRRRKNPKRRAGVGWWRATIYGPGGKVAHRQVARANPAQARASVAALAKRHGRVALDGPFASKPAC